MMATWKRCHYNRATGATAPPKPPCSASSRPLCIARCHGRTAGAGRRRSPRIRAGAGLETFIWRVSVADVASDGPFSRFPGIDRTIMLLEGAGMRLCARGTAMSSCGRHSRRMRSRATTTSIARSSPVPSAISTPCAAGVTHGVALPWCATAALRSRRQRFRLVYAATGTHECVVAAHPAVQPGDRTHAPRRVRRDGRRGADCGAAARARQHRARGSHRMPVNLFAADA